MSSLIDFIYDSDIFIDLYEHLEIDIDAKQEEIKNAYIKLAKKNHPDQGGSSEKFQEITRAYEILYNKELRKEYDLYYLKKNMNEFKGDYTLRLKNEFKDFLINTKPLSKDEIDKLYSETFNEYTEKFNEVTISDKDFSNRLKDIEIERENVQIEILDDTLMNFLEENKININDVFEYLKYKNSNCFEKSIVKKEWETLDLMPGYLNSYSSFVDENEYFNSNLYSNLIDINNTLSKNTFDNLNINEFRNWEKTKHTNKKLTKSEIDNYLQKRQEQETDLFKENELNLENSSKKKEIEKFFKTKLLTEDINRYNNIETNTNTNTNININDKLDNILNYMDNIKK